jgi:hypothetical protein
MLWSPSIRISGSTIGTKPVVDRNFKKKENEFGYVRHNER